ncbi:cytochrome o ubiquinol oxidase subunit IV [Microbulbifer discodermiae]|uniref:cytochrome o ubiquinol oxidase subunit IV n=1 Tax=Microbulbifer sp. 2201CG32-9 TaxID=3232309 RepID=UPI00345BCE87
MNNPPSYEREVRGYLIGFGKALALTLIPFGLVAWQKLPASVVLVVIGVCALWQIVVHGRYFLHIDLSQQKREDLLLILFSVLLLGIMAGGTIFIMANLSHRMH